MSDTELRSELLKIIAAAQQGHLVRASDLLHEAENRWNADEFAVREAIWHLLSTNQVVLTPERTLRIAEAETATL